MILIFLKKVLKKFIYHFQPIKTMIYKNVSDYLASESHGIVVSRILSNKFIIGYYRLMDGSVDRLQVVFGLNYDRKNKKSVLNQYMVLSDLRTTIIYIKQLPSFRYVLCNEQHSNRCFRKVVDVRKYKQNFRKLFKVLKPS